jgi:hypothetical protein
MEQRIYPKSGAYEDEPFFLLPSNPVAAVAAERILAQMTATRIWCSWECPCCGGKFEKTLEQGADPMEAGPINHIRTACPAATGGA